MASASVSATAVQGDVTAVVSANSEVCPLFRLGYISVFQNRLFIIDTTSHATLENNKPHTALLHRVGLAVHGNVLKQNNNDCTVS